MQGSPLTSDRLVDQYNIYYQNYKELSYIDYLHFKNTTKRDIFPLYEIHYYALFGNEKDAPELKKKDVSKEYIAQVLSNEFKTDYVDPVLSINSKTYSKIVYKFNPHTFQNSSGEPYYFKCTDVIGEGNCWFHSTLQSGVFNLANVSSALFEKLCKRTNKGKKSATLHTVLQLRHLFLDLCLVFYYNDKYFKFIVDCYLSREFGDYLFDDALNQDERYQRLKKSDLRRKFEFCVRETRVDRNYMDSSASVLASYIFRCNILIFNPDWAPFNPKEIINEFFNNTDNPTPLQIPDDHFLSTKYIYHHNPDHPFDCRVKDHPMLLTVPPTEPDGDDGIYEIRSFCHYLSLERITEDQCNDLVETGKRIVIECPKEALSQKQKHYHSVDVMKVIDAFSPTAPLPKYLENVSICLDGKTMMLDTMEHEDDSGEIMVNDKQPDKERDNDDDDNDGNDDNPTFDNDTDLVNPDPIPESHQGHIDSSCPISSSAPLPKYLENVSIRLDGKTMLLDSTMEHEDDSGEIMVNDSTHQVCEVPKHHNNECNKQEHDKEQDNNDDDNDGNDNSSTFDNDMIELVNPDPIPESQGHSHDHPISSSAGRNSSCHPTPCDNEEDGKVVKLQEEIASLRKKLSNSEAELKKQSEKLKSLSRKKKLPDLPPSSMKSPQKKQKTKKQLTPQDWYETAKHYFTTHSTVGTKSEILKEVINKSGSRVANLTPRHVQAKLEKFKHFFRKNDKDKSVVPNSDVPPSSISADLSRTRRFVLVEDAVLQYYSDHPDEEISKQKCMDLFRELRSQPDNNLPETFQCSNTWFYRMKHIIKQRRSD